MNVTFATATGANLGSYAPTFVQGNGTTTQTTCATYCHGSSLNATTTRGSVASWTWNGAAADCGSCHRSPPGTANHHNAAALTTCSKCHGGTVNADRRRQRRRRPPRERRHRHLDAHLHHLPRQRDARRHRPPGPERRRRAHRHRRSRHLRQHRHRHRQRRRRPRRPRPRHPVAVRSSATPATPFPAPRSTRPASPPPAPSPSPTSPPPGGIANATYAGAGGTCSNIYCHGNFTGGVGAIVTPTWTTAGALACTSCHGAPPALNATTHHPANTACATCHGTGYTGHHGRRRDPRQRHGDDVSRTGCTLCHGDLTQTAVAATSGASAPGFNATAADTTGATAATAAAVGAHAAHLTGTRWRATALACSECHTVPAAGDVAHATGIGTGGARATVAFGTLARTGGITTAAYAGSTTAAGTNGAGTCSNVYCHGNFKNGATTARPVLARRHRRRGLRLLPRPASRRNPPGRLDARHLRQLPRQLQQHPAESIIDPARHVDGSIDVTNMSCTSCHGTSGRVRASPAPT